MLTAQARFSRERARVAALSELFSKHRKMLPPTRSVLRTRGSILPRIRRLTNRPQPYGRGSLGAVPDHRTALLIELVQAAWFMQLSLAGSLQRPNRVASPSCCNCP